MPAGERSRQHGQGGQELGRGLAEQAVQLAQVAGGVAQGVEAPPHEHPQREQPDHGRRPPEEQGLRQIRVPVGVVHDAGDEGEADQEPARPHQAAGAEVVVGQEEAEVQEAHGLLGSGKGWLESHRAAR